MASQSSGGAGVLVGWCPGAGTRGSREGWWALCASSLVGLAQLAVACRLAVPVMRLWIQCAALLLSAAAFSSTWCGGGLAWEPTGAAPPAPPSPGGAAWGSARSGPAAVAGGRKGVCAPGGRGTDTGGGRGPIPGGSISGPEAGMTPGAPPLSCCSSASAACFCAASTLIWLWKCLSILVCSPCMCHRASSLACRARCHSLMALISSASLSLNLLSMAAISFLISSSLRPHVCSWTLNLSMAAATLLSLSVCCLPCSASSTSRCLRSSSFSWICCRRSSISRSFSWSWESNDLRSLSALVRKLVRSSVSSAICASFSIRASLASRSSDCSSILRWYSDSSADSRPISALMLASLCSRASPLAAPLACGPNPLAWAVPLPCGPGRQAKRSWDCCCSC
mmetsp:Transcript_7298/g.20585  ORF Transcript_7298/g.20585 Transcript_7298/m.20585 type:complete len:396 (+) Transcript_7298:1097-2284(+)